MDKVTVVIVIINNNNNNVFLDCSFSEAVSMLLLPIVVTEMDFIP